MTHRRPARRTPILVLVALMLGAGAATASAASPAGGVKITEKRVVLDTGTGRVVVKRSPFRMTFVDRRGRVLLREVARPEGGPVSLPETEDPEPYSLERKPDNARYAPLSFEVGTKLHEQWNGSIYGGNTLFLRRQGTVHHARSVRGARRISRGVRLVVATTDRSRRMIVRLTRDRGGAVRVRARLTSGRGVISFGDSFKAGAREGFHGFGGRHGTVNKRGEKLYGWAEQENFGGEGTLLPGLAVLPLLVDQGSDYNAAQLGEPPTPLNIPGGFERYLFPGGPNAAYYPQAEFVSSRGYGFLLNQSQFSRWRMANDRPDAWQVQVSARRLDYTVVLGPGRRSAVSGLTRITGRHQLPPRWAQGPTVWRAVQVPNVPGQPRVETAESYRAKIEQDLRDIDRYDAPLTAYAFEGWALLGDLDYVRSVTRRLKRRGIRTILYVRAFVSNDVLATERPGTVEEALRRGLVATERDGDPYEFNSAGAPAYMLDFTDPATLKWWRKKLKLLISLGADGFMQDFGEQVQNDMHFHDGSTGATMHNRFPVLFHRASRRILDSISKRRGLRQRFWFFTRNGYSGRPGSAAYEMGTFPGDETTDWNAASGLRSLAPDMLNRGIGGAFGFTTDIGGYIDYFTGQPDEELYNRWMEWSALTPYFRIHNSASKGTRMPWSYGAATLGRWKRLAALHQRALPLIRRLWKRGRRTGMPIARPMWLAAPEAPGAQTESQQWLLGRDVLVAPIVHEGASSRSVSFPQGCWERQGPAASKRFRGPARATVQAPVGDLPYFFRCGTKPF